MFLMELKIKLNEMCNILTPSSSTSIQLDSIRYILRRQTTYWNLQSFWVNGLVRVCWMHCVQIAVAINKCIVCIAVYNYYVVHFSLVVGCLIHIIISFYNNGPHLYVCTSWNFVEMAKFVCLFAFCNNCSELSSNAYHIAKIFQTEFYLEYTSKFMSIAFVFLLPHCIYI